MLCETVPDAEFAKDVAKNFVGENFADNLGKVGDTLIKVFADEVTAHLVLEPLWLRKEIAEKINRMWNKYSASENKDKLV